MWTELFLESKDNLIFQLDYFIEKLKKYSDVMKNHDAVILKQLLKDGREAKGRRNLICDFAQIFSCFFVNRRPFSLLLNLILSFKIDIIINHKVYAEDGELFYEKRCFIPKIIVTHQRFMRWWVSCFLIRCIYSFFDGEYHI